MQQQKRDVLRSLNFKMAPFQPDKLRYTQRADAFRCVKTGIATSESLHGPWRRLNAPLFGPDPTAWDNIDVSNPSPIIHRDGSVVMMYKGRGKLAQHMGLATAPSVDGPYTRNGSLSALPDLPGEDPWGWIDDKTGTYHVCYPCRTTHSGSDTR